MRRSESQPGPPLNDWDAVWDLHEDQCPCDVHFVEFLDREQVRDAAIFHFGTGAHHYVGLRCAEEGRGNSVLGITASRGEYDAYIDLALKRPKISASYKALFGDIYLLNEALLPSFDVVTLFHLCEFRSEQNDRYGAMTDLDLTRLLLRKTRPGGSVLFYTGSMAFEAAQPVITELERSGLLQPVGAYKSLIIYKRTEAPSAIA